MLLNATWIDFKQRLSKTFASVGYFVSRFPFLLDQLDMDLVNDQFLTYQIMKEEDIPASLQMGTLAILTNCGVI